MAAANFLESLVCLDFDQMSILLVHSGLPIEVCEILSRIVQLCALLLCAKASETSQANKSRLNYSEDFLELTLSSEDGAVMLGQVSCPDSPRLAHTCVSRRASPELLRDIASSPSPDASLWEPG